MSEQVLVPGEPALSLERLRAEYGAGRPVPLLAFYGHRGSSQRPGPHVLSQWWPQPFTLGRYEFATAEHAMMAAKAWIFGDARTHKQILTAPTPAAAKALGRQVRNFDQAVWDARAYALVVQANAAKFGQHPQLGRYLRSTAPAVLVEASATDRIWGIGCGVSDAATTDPRRWRGRNLLGFALTEVRDVHLSPQLA